MRRTTNPREPQDDLYWMESIAKGILWAEGLVVSLLTLSLLAIGTGLYRHPAVTEFVLRGLLGTSGLQ